MIGFLRKKGIKKHEAVACNIRNRQQTYICVRKTRSSRMLHSMYTCMHVFLQMCMYVYAGNLCVPMYAYVCMHMHDEHACICECMHARMRLSALICCFFYSMLLYPNISTHRLAIPCMHSLNIDGFCDPRPAVFASYARQTSNPRCSEVSFRCLNKVHDQEKPEA